MPSSHMREFSSSSDEAVRDNDTESEASVVSYDTTESVGKEPEVDVDAEELMHEDAEFVENDDLDGENLLEEETHNEDTIQAESEHQVVHASPEKESSSYAADAQVSVPSTPEPTITQEPHIASQPFLPPPLILTESPTSQPDNTAFDAPSNFPQKSTDSSAYQFFVNSLARRLDASNMLPNPQSPPSPHNVPTLFEHAFNHFQQNRSEWIHWMNSMSVWLRKMDANNNSTQNINNSTVSTSSEFAQISPSSASAPSPSAWIESKFNHIDSLEIEAQWRLSLKRLIKQYQAAPNTDEWINSLVEREATLQKKEALLKQDHQLLEQERDAHIERQHNIDFEVQQLLNRRQLELDSEHEKKVQHLAKLRKQVEKQRHQMQLEKNRLKEERNAFIFEKEQFEQQREEEQKQLKKQKSAMKRQLKFMRSMESIFRKKSSNIIDKHSPNQSSIIKKLHDTINQMENKLNDDDYLDVEKALSDTSSLMSSGPDSPMIIHSPRLDLSDSEKSRSFSRLSQSPLKSGLRVNAGVQAEIEPKRPETTQEEETEPLVPQSEEALREQQELFTMQWKMFEEERRSLQRRQRKYQNEEIKLRQEKETLDASRAELNAKQENIETSLQKFTHREQEIQALEEKLDRRESKVSKMERKLSKREKEIRATAKDLEAALKESEKELAIFHEKRQKLEDIERLLLVDYQRRKSGLNSPRPHSTGGNAALMNSPRAISNVLLHEDGEGMSGFTEPNLSILAIDFNLRMKDMREREKSLKQREKFCFEREVQLKRLEAVVNVRVDDCRVREQRVTDREKRLRAFELRLRRHEREFNRRALQEGDFENDSVTTPRIPHTAR